MKQELKAFFILLISSIILVTIIIFTLQIILASFNNYEVTVYYNIYNEGLSELIMITCSLPFCVYYIAKWTKKEIYENFGWDEK